MFASQFLLLLLAAPPAAEGPTAEQIQFFETSVRPLLAAHCFKCHGETKQKGQLRLDSVAAMLKGGESGPAIVRGQPEESLLIEAVEYASFEMPPTGRLKDDQIDALKHWVRMGAPWPDDGKLDRVSASRPSGITDEDRAYWAFQPVGDSEVSRIDDRGWCRNEIDRFVVRKLHEQGLQPSGAAEARTLIRRLYFDLIGLPPTAEEIDDWSRRLTATADGSGPAEAQLNEAAYQQLIDQLLASPHYGERWARHWLDLVRYAESDGYKQDDYRPNAWRYRDYVIRAFNTDKPWPRFVLEQLAGDEIVPSDPEALTATGYLRHWIYEYNQRDVRTQWDTIVNDITSVTGEVFLGLGMGCSRCHDHKFDPIPQRDYFRLRAFFAAVLPRDDVSLATTPEREEYGRMLTVWDEKTADIRRELAQIERPVYDGAARPQINKFPPDIRPMMFKSANERGPFEQQLVELAFRQVRPEFEKLKMESKLKGDERARWEALTKELAAYDSLKPQPLATGLCVTDVGRVAPPTTIPDDRTAQDIPPGYLSVLDPGDAEIPPQPDSTNSTGRRTALARWIANPDNPLTTRVIVNRIWQYHFGRGLAPHASDFGRLGGPPTHPELLDWLVARFIDDGWSFKKLHRRILTSATYRQSSQVEASADAARRVDPENRLLWRRDVRRLDAEQIRDAMLVVAGELDSSASGASVDAGSPRRSIYTKVIRNQRDPLLDVFDAPDNFNSTSERNVTTTPVQSLLMFNGGWTLKRAQALAHRCENQNFTTGERLVQFAYRRVLGRQPAPNEAAAAMEFLEKPESGSNNLAPTSGPVSPGTSTAASALTDFCHVLLNSNEFLYVD